MYTTMQPSANAVDTPADSATSRAPINFKLPELKIATFSQIIASTHLNILGL